MQGLAFLVTFGAIAKSDWPRAATERAGGMQSQFVQQTHCTRLHCASRGFTHWIPGCAEDDARWASPLTLTLSREARGDKCAARAQRAR